MEFRYREMVYRPEYYDFNTEDRAEWFPVGVFSYNVSRIISDLEQFEKDPDAVRSFKASVIKRDINVAEAIRYNFGLGNLEKSHILQADIERPLIYVELAPDSYNLIDGNHRLAKAKQLGVEVLSAFFIQSHEAIRYLSSEAEYCDYVDYWNGKVEIYDTDTNYHGLFCPEPTLGYERDMDEERIWGRMMSELAACRRIELYSEGSWFTLFRLNDKVYCGESEAHAPSCKCAAPFAVTKDAISKAAVLFEEWQHYDRWDKRDRAERRRNIRKQIRNADIIMACVRVFSEY